MKKSKIVKLICANPKCDIIFDRYEADYLGDRKWGKKNFYHSRKCSEACKQQVWPKIRIYT